MSDTEHPVKSNEERILGELNFLGEHIIYIERTLQDILRRLGDEPREPPVGLTRS